MNTIRFHHTELDSATPFAAIRAGRTLHVLINTNAALDLDEWVRDFLAGWVCDAAMAPPVTAQRIAKVIDMEIYLHRSMRNCSESTSQMITAD